MSDGPRQRQQRERAKVSLSALAREMKISAPYLLDLERGFRRWSDTLRTRHELALRALNRRNPTLVKGGT